MMVFTPQHATRFSSSNFPSPTTFLPERFLSTSPFPTPHRYAWRPFERGPRACLGQELAMEEMRIIFLLAVRWSDFEAVVEKSERQKVE